MVCVLYTEVAPWRELLDPNVASDRATSDPHYGRADRFGAPR